MAELVFFKDSHIALRKEVVANKELYSTIIRSGCADVNEALGHICAYCNIVVDGYYTPQEIADLIEELVLILRDKNKVIG